MEPESHRQQYTQQWDELLELFPELSSHVRRECHNPFYREYWEC